MFVLYNFVLLICFILYVFVHGMYNVMSTARKNRDELPLIFFFLRTDDGKEKQDIDDYFQKLIFGECVYMTMDDGAMLCARLSIYYIPTVITYRLPFREQGLVDTEPIAAPCNAGKRLNGL